MLTWYAYIVIAWEYLALVCTKFLGKKAVRIPMTKKTIFLFFKALIIGLILNLGVQQASNVELQAANDQIASPKVEQAVIHTPAAIKAKYSD